MGTRNQNDRDHRILQEEENQYKERQRWIDRHVQQKTKKEAETGKLIDRMCKQTKNENDRDHQSLQEEEPTATNDRERQRRRRTPQDKIRDRDKPEESTNKSEKEEKGRNSSKKGLTCLLAVE